MPVHQLSDDPVLHYELRPRSALESDARPRGSEPGTGRRYRVTINEHGARGPAHPLRKAPDVFRIVFVGGSTLYGAGVDDDETMAASLERALNERAALGRRVEVWNFGTSAYNLLQVTRVAERSLERLDPDLVLVQLFNENRRAFLVKDQAPQDAVLRFVHKDPYFVREHASARPLNAAALRWSALYRSYAALVILPGVDVQPESVVGLSVEAVARLRARAAARSIPLRFIPIPAMRRCFPVAVCDDLPSEHVLVMNVPGRAPEFYEVHPPAPVLAEYGRIIADWLVADPSLGLAGPGASTSAPTGASTGAPDHEEKNQPRRN